MSVVLQFLPTLRISLCRRPPTSCRWYFNFYLHYGSACAGDHRLHVGGASISTYATDLPAQETTDFMSVVLQFLPTLLPAQETTDFMSVVLQFLPTLRISLRGDHRLHACRWCFNFYLLGLMITSAASRNQTNIRGAIFRRKLSTTNMKLVVSGDLGAGRGRPKLNYHQHEVGGLWRPRSRKR